MRLLSFVTTLLLVAVAYFFFVTRFSGNIMIGEELGVAFDSLAAHLVQFSSEVDPKAIEHEAYVTDGRVHMYHGMFPALLRIIPNFLFPKYYGQWSRVSCILGALVCFLIFLSMCQRLLRSNSALTERDVHSLLCVSAIGFGLGTPLVFLLSYAWLYHESILWGLAGALLGVSGIWEYFGESQRRGIMFLAIGCVLSLLSRVTFSIPFHILFVLLGCLMIRNDRQRPFFLVVPSLIVVFGLLLQSWYNFDRFGSIFLFINYEGSSFQPDYLGGQFHFGRIISNLYNYFGLRLDHFQLRLPFVVLQPPEYFKPELFLHWKERTLSLTIASSWLVVSGLWGSWVVFCSGSKLQRIVLVFLVFCTWPILSFYFATQRYAAEFIPPLVFAYGALLRSSSVKSVLTMQNRAFFAVLLVIWSLLASSLSAISYSMYFE